MNRLLHHSCTTVGALKQKSILDCYLYASVADMRALLVCDYASDANKSKLENLLEISSF